MFKKPWRRFWQIFGKNWDYGTGLKMYNLELHKSNMGFKSLIQLLVNS